MSTNGIPGKKAYVKTELHLHGTIAGLTKAFLQKKVKFVGFKDQSHSNKGN